MNLCPRCILSLMREHPELLLWLKCPTCGFSKINPQMVELYPNLDKLTPRNINDLSSLLISPNKDK